MAKRRTKAQHERSRLISEGYSECRSCEKMLGPGVRRCPACGALTASTKKGLAALAIVAVLVIAATGAYVLYPREEPYSPPPTVMSVSPTGYSAPASASISVAFNRAMDVASVESSFSISPAVEGTFSWSGYTMTFNPAQALPEDSYFTVTIGGSARDADGDPLDCGVYAWSFSTADLPTVRRGIGTGSQEFWTVYPAGHPSSGQPVAHPDWVTAALEDGVLLILAHSEGCYPCVQQTQICDSVSASDPELQYSRLVSRVNEPEASQAFTAYDPNGGMHYVPLTIILTRTLDGFGAEIVAWHSWEGVVDLVTLTSWIQDAKSYYAELA